MSVDEMIERIHNVGHKAYGMHSRCADDIIAALRAGQQMREALKNYKYYSGWSQIDPFIEAWDTAVGGKE